MKKPGLKQDGEIAKMNAIKEITKASKKYAKEIKKQEKNNNKK